MKNVLAQSQIPPKQEMDLFGPVKLYDGLFLGDDWSSQDLEFVVTNKITHIINCAARQVPNYFESIGIKYMNFFWNESDTQVVFDSKDEVLKNTYNFIANAHRLGESVLVHSVRGHNRAVCVVVTFLMKKFRWCLYKTLEFVQSRKPELEMRANFFNQLVMMENKLSRVETGPKTQKWEELADLSLGINSEELLISNTFLNSRAETFAGVQSRDGDTTDKKSAKSLKWIDKNLPNADKSKLITMVIPPENQIDYAKRAKTKRAATAGSGPILRTLATSLSNENLLRGKYNLKNEDATDKKDFENNNSSTSLDKSQNKTTEAANNNSNLFTKINRPGAPLSNNLIKNDSKVGPDSQNSFMKASDISQTGNLGFQKFSSNHSRTGSSTDTELPKKPLGDTNSLITSSKMQDVPVVMKQIQDPRTNGAFYKKPPTPLEAMTREDSLKRGTGSKPDEGSGSAGLSENKGKMLVKKKDNKVVKLIRYDSQKEFEKRLGESEKSGTVEKEDEKKAKNGMLNKVYGQPLQILKTTRPPIALKRNNNNNPNQDNSLDSLNMIANKQLKEAIQIDDKKKTNDNSNIFKKEDSDLTPTTLEKNSLDDELDQLGTIKTSNKNFKIKTVDYWNRYPKAGFTNPSQDNSRNNDEPNNSAMKTFSYFDQKTETSQKPPTKPFSETYTEGLTAMVGSNQTLKQKITANSTMTTINKEGTYLKTIPGFGATTSHIPQEKVTQVNNFFSYANNSALMGNNNHNNPSNANSNVFSNSNGFIKKSGPIRAFNYETQNQKKLKANNSNGFQTTVISFPDNMGSDYDAFNKKGRPSTAPLKGKKIKTIANQTLPRESQRNSSLPPSKTQETSKTKMRSSSPGYNKIKENNAAMNTAVKPTWVV